MITKVSTSEAVVNHFKDQIHQGKLKPGDKLPSERELQSELGISRFALREGLVRLNALGIITITQGKGSFISEDAKRMVLSDVFLPLFLEDNPRYLDDLYYARCVIERDLVYLATFRRSEEDIANLEKILEKAKASIDQASLFGELDFQFHREIARIAQNIFLQRMHEVLYTQIRIFLIDLSKHAEVRAKIYEEHEKILTIIKNQNGDDARELMTNHLRQCKDSYDEKTYVKGLYSYSSPEEK